MDIIVPCAEQATVRLDARGMSATVFSCDNRLEELQYSVQCWRTEAAVINC